MPLQSNLEDLQEKLVGLGAGAQAVGLEDHRAMLAATRRRTREGYEASARAAGFEPVSGDDEMGDLVITGDIEMNKNHEPPVSKPNGGISKTLGAAALGAALVAGPLLGYWLATPDSGPPSIDTNTQNTIRPDDYP
jgi:hypothetical protein